MIFDTKKEKDAIQVGDIQNNKVSIDTDNIDFIVTILSTNLYSDTIGSFIRETVSNAWDSHKEAEVDTPVILELGTDVEGENFCRVQDFGVGLSPERFNKIYKNIGSSTKRTSNDQIGGFGIGRFSALAYSDVVYITSIFDGIEYVYMMYKDGNSISIDLFNEKETTEGNGVEVKVPVKDGDLKKFKEAIKGQLVYFENLYVCDSIDYNKFYIDYLDVNLEEEYSAFKVKKYKNFWVNNLKRNYSYNVDKVNIILGKVCYPLRISSLDKNYSDTVRKYPISLTFEIGELSVTPNREEVLYSSANKKVIEDKFNAALDELTELQKEKSTEDYSSLTQFITAIETVNTFELIEGSTPITILGAQASGCTLKGESYNNDKFLRSYNILSTTRLVKMNYTLKASKITYKNELVPLKKIISNFADTYFCDISKLSNITKSYIRDTFPDGAYFLPKEENYSSIYGNVKTMISKLKYEDIYDKRIFSLLVNNVLTNFSKAQKFTNSDVPKQWLKDRKAAQITKRKQIKTKGFDWSQKVNLHIYRRTESGYGVTTDSKAVELKKLNQKYKKLTVYGEKDCLKTQNLFSTIDLMFATTTRNIINVVAIAPTKMKLLENIENFVHIDEFMNDINYPLIRNIATAEYLKENMPHLKDLAKIRNLSKISERYKDIVAELYSFYCKYEASNIYNTDVNEMRAAIYELAKEKKYFNEEIKGLYLANQEELKAGKAITTIVYSESYIANDQVNLVVDYLLARKLIKPSTEAVLKLRKETIYNITEEDENN